MALLACICLSCGLPINSGTLFLIPFIPDILVLKAGPRWELKQKKKNSDMPPITNLALVFDTKHNRLCVH
jgi:hypothetical protein